MSEIKERRGYDTYYHVTPTQTGDGKIAKKKEMAEMRANLLEDYLDGKIPHFNTMNISDTGTDALPFDKQVEILKLIQAGITAKVMMLSAGREITIPTSIEPDVEYINAELAKRGYVFDNLSQTQKRKIEYLVDEGSAARHSFFMHNLGFATLMAQREQRKKELDPYTFGEVLEEAKIGLMFAIDKFDPTSGYRFSTYSTHWIRQKMLAFLDEKAKLIRVSTPMNSVYKNIEFAKKELRNVYVNDKEITPDIIHNWLAEHGRDISVEQIDEAMSLRKDTISLDIYTTDDGNHTIADLKASDDDTETEVLDSVGNTSIFNRLVALVTDKRNQELLRDWYTNDAAKEPMLVSNLSRKYGVTRSEVYKMKKAAEEEIQKAIQTQHLDYLAV